MSLYIWLGFLPDSFKMCAKSSKDPVVANFSKFIHPRNPYRKYDFEALAKEFLEFKSYLSTGPSKDPDKPGKIYLNWADRDAVRCLMKCCLKKDFSLDLVIAFSTVMTLFTYAGLQ